MAEKVYDLGGRFNNGFGFITANTGESLQDTGFEDSLTGATIQVKDGRSSYEEFTLTRSDNSNISLTFGYSGLFNYEDSVFAPPAMVSFKRSKRIDETIVSEHDQNDVEVATGQVVENYGKMPVEFSIQGLLIDMVHHQYPSEKVRQLVELFEYDGIWDVSGQIFRDQKIRSLYIKDMEDGPVQGYMDTWKFSLQCRSMKPVEWGLKNKQ
ncbi:MAG: DUF6046 domain-containing protein [Bacteroidia bacterium]|nr:DUF6046 domain-containing protein [Bacteroidia bacterium]